MIRNQEVVQTLEAIADLLEAKGDNPYRVGAYRTAARNIANLSEDITAIWQQGRLDDIPGVGEALAAKIDELLRTGSLSYYERLKAEVGLGLAELVQIPGLGPKRARKLSATLGIQTALDLRRAAEEHRLRDVPGFGAKVEANLLRELQRLDQRTRRLPLGLALAAAEEVAGLLRQKPAVIRAEPAGSIRRMRDTIGDIDILVASDQPAAVVGAFTHLDIAREVLASGDTRASILTPTNLQIDLRVVEPAVFGAALQYFTGSKEHNVALRELAIRNGLTLSEYGLKVETSHEIVAAENKEDIYRRLGLPWIPPELRENRGEIQAGLAGKLPDTVGESDLRGDLHVHTDWSDGSAPIEIMVREAQQRGYQYVAITDHSVGLGIAHGLTSERVAAQRQVIEALNRDFAPFRILQGIEVDIRSDGRLDYPDEVLAQFDIVTASIHSAFDQAEEVVTERILMALRNPYVDVLNHPSGRLLGKRDGYPVDLDRVISEAGRREVALEINSQPDRLDLTDFWARRAAEAGVRLVISSDAHAPSQLALVRYGVSVARRAWVEPQSVLNTLALSELLPALRRNRSDRPKVSARSSGQ